MATNVIMPQMGESIAEGTITTWLKKVGEKVNRDEPLFEISTDKVDAEIPSPASGVLLEIKVEAGKTVAINTVVALIGESGEATQPTKSAPAAAPTPASAPAPATPAKAPAVPAPQLTAHPSPAALPAHAASPALPAHPTGELSAEERRRVKSSPVVRKIAAEHQVDITRLSGTGLSGRVTKQDILGHLQGGGASAAASPRAAGSAAPVATSAGAATLLPQSAPAPTGTGYGVYDARAPIPDAYRGRVFAGDRVEPMSTMRAKISEHMTLSRRISAHVQTVWDMDFSHVAKLREKYKAAWNERHGVNLTYTAFIMKATVDALKAFPVLNSSVDGNNVIYHQHVNLGMAVALDWGLIVPVVHSADELNVLGLARRLSDMANRARQRKLMPDEISGGTFTITNPGVFGPMFGLPVINQPQVGILGVGAVEKRPVVIDDMLAIRTRAYLSMSFDHRIVDGAVADQFMARVKQGIEGFDEGQLG